MSKAKVFTVIIALDKTVPTMKPGMSAQVAIVIGESGEQLLVPRSALRFEGKTTVVTRLEGEKMRRPVAVTIVSSDALHYAVAATGALKDGDRILKRGDNQ